MPSSGKVNLAGRSLRWAVPTAKALALFEREIGRPLTDQSALRSVRGRAFLLWLSFEAAESGQITFEEIRGWPISLIASPSISHFLKRAAPSLGIEEPDPRDALRPRRRRRAESMMEAVIRRAT